MEDFTKWGHPSNGGLVLEWGGGEVVNTPLRTM